MVRANPGLDKHNLRAGDYEEDLQGTERIDHDAIEADEDLDIEFLIASQRDYRKRELRKLVIEPFLIFLERNGIVPSRKLPRTKMMTALYDWLGVEQKNRPNAVDTIARELRLRRSVNHNDWPDYQ
jgi:hypothetical protein